MKFLTGFKIFLSDVALPRFTVICFLLLSVCYQALGGEIIKSGNDNRSYRALQLDNGLRALAVHDPAATLAAVSVTVGVGSLHNPYDVPGLAHFLEHMLFLGNAKYPEANSYSEFLSRNNGRFNAFTADKETTYFLEIGSDKLPEAIDRISQFFVSPLFDEHWIERELNAVEAEHSLHIRNDGQRFYAVLQDLLSPNHPLSFFSTGNKETLSITGARNRVIEFYKKYYGASIITVAVVDSRPLDEIEEMTRRSFADVAPGGKLPRPYAGSKYQPELTPPLKVEMKTIEKMDMLSIMLSLPARGDSPQEDLDALMYLSNIIGCEQPGCPASLLKNEGLITSLSASSRGGNAYGQGIAVFLPLTEAGKERIGDIVGLLLNYFRLIQKTGPEKWRFDESKAISRHEFDFQPKKNAVGLAIELSSKLQYVPPESVMTYERLLGEYNPGKIIELAEFLDPRNIAVTYQSASVQGNRTEPWYGAEYSARKLSNAELAKWEESGRKLAANRLSLPKPNEYIPKSNALLKDPTASSPPVKLEDTDIIEWWYKNDISFGEPTAIANINLHAPGSFIDQKDEYLTSILLRHWNNQIMAELEPAILAGNTLEIAEGRKGLRIKVQGPAETMQTLVGKVIKIVKESLPDERRFNDYRKDIGKELDNVINQIPLDWSFMHYTYLEDEHTRSLDEKSEAFKALNYEDLKAQSKKIFKQARIKGMIYGNTDEKLARSIRDIVVAGFNVSGLSKEKLQKDTYLLMSPGTAARYAFKTNHVDSGYVAIFQSEDRSLKRGLELDMLNQIISDKFYHIVRTEKQRGYVAQAFATSSNRSNRIFFIVQSPTVEPTTLAKDLEEFLPSAREILAGLSEQDFLATKEALRRSLAKPPINLVEAYSDYIKAIYGEDFEFRFQKTVLERLEGITKEDLLNAFDKVLLGKERRMMELMAFSEKAQEIPQLDGNISDLSAMKASQPRIVELPIVD